MMRLRNKGVSQDVTNGEIKTYYEKEKVLLSEFSVEVYPLEGKEIIASIVASVDNSSVKRKITITDFNGNPIPEIEPFTTVLRPPQIQKDFYTSFYETHLKEIPDRLRDILNFYVQESNHIPDFNLKKGFLRRRFGEKFGGLRRIIISGMGSAYNMSFAARQFIEASVPKVEVLTMKPVDVENPMNVICPEKDLVVLLSWSGTTAEIVQFASLLKSYNVAMVVITEKFFSDLGLIAEKSGGAISTFSGEEVTVSGVKSTICILFCLYLFGVWLCSRLESEKIASGLMKPLYEIPDKIKHLLEDEDVRNFCQLLSKESAHSYVNFVVDALNTVGTGREVAIKLEESSWSSMGKFLDYRDFYIHGLKKDMNENLVLVNATYKPRLHEAIEVMRKLYLEKIPFAGVAIPIREQAEIDMFCHNRCVILPETEPVLQPIIDFTFYYIFSFYYGVAHGRSADFPRNRAKSVTAGRTLWTKQMTPAGEVYLLEEITQKVKENGSLSTAWCQSETTWEAMASEFPEKTHFREMRRLLQLLSTDHPLYKLVHTDVKGIHKSIHHLRKAMAEEREIIFIPLDRPARSAAENLKIQWNRLLPTNIRVANRFRLGFSERIPGRAIIFLLASRPAESIVQKAVCQKLVSSSIYVGPEFSDFEAKVFKHSLSNCFFKQHFSFCEPDLIYVIISLMFIEGLREISSRRAKTVASYFGLSSYFLGTILNNGVLKKEIDNMAADNKKYKTAIFLGPPNGTGMLWTDRFDQSAGIVLQNHFYGDGAHGFLVTVDPRVDQKYIRVAPRNQMIPEYGTKQVKKWEDRFLNGDTTDVFLNRSPAYLTFYPETPFFAEGNWYFPVLREDYDTTEDNLIMIDATSQRHLEQTQDELATFGCRYARLIVFTQEAFLGAGQKISFFKYPISQLIMIPPLYKDDTHMIPVRSLILPLTMSLISSAVAGSTVRAQIPETIAEISEEKKGVEI
jgi:glucosamine 6-phosphate synthetase-like amidotransferase/phosphosugar isomerase protein